MVPVAKRDEALESKYAEIASAELVITDRLHGVIFCAITGTPCIVVESKSHKVGGCYEWIKNLEYIRIVNDMDQIGEVCMQMRGVDPKYDNSHLLDYYHNLGKDILEILPSD